MNQGGREENGPDGMERSKDRRKKEKIRGKEQIPDDPLISRYNRSWILATEVNIFPYSVHLSPVLESCTTFLVLEELKTFDLSDTHHQLSPLP